MSEEKKMRFSRGEMVFYRLKTRSKTANIAEINEEKVKRDVQAWKCLTYITDPENLIIYILQISH